MLILIIFSVCVLFFLYPLIDYLQRVDLIQDLRFETATTKIKATPDGEYLIASGVWEFRF